MIQCGVRAHVRTGYMAGAINDEIGWRWTFFTIASPGVIIFLMLFFTVCLLLLELPSYTQDFLSLILSRFVIRQDWKSQKSRFIQSNKPQ